MRARVFVALWFIKMNFICPYCNQATTITSPNHSEGRHRLNTSEALEKFLSINHVAIVCPNLNCKRLTLSVNIARHGDSDYDNHGFQILKEWRLLPGSSSKPQPNFIPIAIRDDYDEACAVLPHSAKASATLSRRCLQGIVRDYWSVPSGKRGNLGAELSFIKDKVAPDTWEAIQAIRSVGDIGAHMEKDVNFVVDVEPEEASLLIELIEMLFEDWYIQSHKRKERSDKAKEIVSKKLAEKKAAKAAAKEAEDNQRDN